MSGILNAQKAALLPLFLVIILLGSEVINHLIRDRDLASEVLSRARFVEEVNDLVHQLQRERGYSSGFLASDGRYLGQEMARERALTDRVLASVLGQWAGGGDRLVPDPVLADLSDVTAWRAQIDALRISGADVLSRYTRLVNGLLGATEVQSISVTRDALPLMIETRQAIAQAKEAAGLQRAAGSMALGAHAMDKALHARVLTLAAREETFLSLASLKAEAASRPLKAIKTTQFEQMDAVRRDLIDMGYGGTPPAVSPAEWFAISSAWVDRLRAEENRLNAAISHVSETAAERAKDALILRGLCVLFAMFLLAYQFRRGNSTGFQQHRQEMS
ncbi:nitrate- and nitrite sensing domain-containing protein [uncultured Tateyamaria sp.]|uniref:nitrate- and nitrite sensing domain-containing protein n=1 Tax=uncultured Tateyamaria sp. TaxID=455651 RepID=UPI00262E309E|nr:nitrate- and nitrite sensing domain-containing protein [uncultured Tateyamaria sp.]